MTSAQVFTLELCAQLSLLAREQPRLRSNYNFHKSFDDPCQRFLNAVEPASYIRPHRHLSPAKSETIVLLHGSLQVVIFDDNGAVLTAEVLSHAAGQVGIDIPAGCWHSLAALETGTVFFEVKPGPYLPLAPDDWADWAPAEGDPAVPDYQLSLQQRLDCIKRLPGGSVDA